MPSVINIVPVLLMCFSPVCQKVNLADELGDEKQRKFTCKATEMFGKKAFFLIFCTVFVVGGAFSQAMAPIKPTLLPLKAPPAKGWATAASVKALPVAPPPPVRITVLPAAFSTAHWGFFCRQELKWEKATNIALRFRLGSLQQCDWLEGKRRLPVP